MTAFGLGGRAAVVALTIAAMTVGGCATPEAPSETFPPASIRPSRTVTPAVNQTRAELVRVLGEVNLVLSDTQVAVRPTEAPLLAEAPRVVYQVILPDDPTRGFVVVYEFSDSARAAAAAAEEQRYLASGPGRIQAPEGTVHVLRQVGSTVVLYEWLPGAAEDADAPAIQRALETLGVGFPIDS